MLLFYVLTELSDTSRETKSDTWPTHNERQHRSKEVKRRFSWENLAKSKDSKNRPKLKRRRHKFTLPLNIGSVKKLSSPISSKSTFKTSTPLKGEKEITQKIGESGFGSSSSISHVTFGNKPINTAQTTTCSDRLGVPKTSLNDFKRLLLNATNKQRISAKPSAVEQLKLKHDSLNASSPIKILDLSASPKSFMNRRILQPAQHASGSYKKIMSPRSRWKYNNFNKSVIASIPEANFEDDATATATVSTSQAHEQSSQAETQNPSELQNNPIYATPKKKLTAITETNIEANKSAFVPIIAKTESSPETGVIETNFSMEENMFLQAEENNFMPGEIKPFGRKSLARKVAPSTKIAEEETSTASSMPTLETSF